MTWPSQANESSSMILSGAMAHIQYSGVVVVDLVNILYLLILAALTSKSL